MTDNGNKKSLSELAKEVEDKREERRLEDKVLLDGKGVDGVLRILARIADSLEFEMSITLFVEGTIVSGILIGATKFWGLQREELIKNGVHEDLAKALTDYDYSPPADDEPAPILNFIHLKNAKVHMHDGGSRYGGELLWRGKLKAVSAFMMGAPTPAK